MQTLTASRRTVTWHPFSQLKKMSFLLLSLWQMIETLSGWEDMRRMMWRVPGSGQTGLLSPATQTGDKDSQTIWMVMKTACVWWEVWWYPLPREEKVLMQKVKRGNNSLLLLVLHYNNPRLYPINNINMITQFLTFEHPWYITFHFLFDFGDPIVGLGCLNHHELCSKIMLRRSFFCLASDQSSLRRQLLTCWQK